MLQKKKYRNILLLLAAVCFLCQCSGKESAQTDTKAFDTYFKIDSTYIGISTVATDLKEPWEITWGSDGWIWMTLHSGVICKVNPSTGKKITLLNITDVVYEGTTPGMLGMAIYPDQKKHPYLFVLYNTKNKNDKITLNVVRYTVKGDTLIDPKILLKIPGADGHQGSRITVSPEGKLMIATGNAFKNAQNVHLLAGKILRINIDGSIPDDNPFSGSVVWAWGFRNPQGLTYGNGGRLYSSVHGPATDDEVNLITKGGNYGWPEVKGYCDESDEIAFCADSSVVEPLIAWTPTIAPAGLGYYKYNKIPEWQNSLILITLKDHSIHVLQLNNEGTSIEGEHVYLKDIYGRLRDVAVSPEGVIYIATSNRDWKPNPGDRFPSSHDDRIIRLSKVENMAYLEGIPSLKQIYSKDVQHITVSGALIYQQNCIACHKSDGEGAKGLFSSLSGNKFVTGSKKRLISIVLNGHNSEALDTVVAKYQGVMPAFRSLLSDEEIAQVLTYIRSNFGNNATKVSKKEVQAVRDSPSVKRDK